MKQLLIVFFAAALFATACKEKSKTEKDPATQANSFSADSTAIRETVVSFYEWYTKNWERFNRYDLYDGAKKEDAPPYKIDWDEAAKYKQFIQDSVPQLGATFVSNIDLLLRKCDSAFKVDVGDDVPYFFDFDWYTNTQEDPAYLLEEMKKSNQWDIKINGDDASVEVKGFDEGGTRPAATVIRLQMKKESGQWKIAKTWSE
jgi:hypothetical protein